MTDLIRRLREHPLKFNPSASVSDVAALETELNGSLPEELRALYLDHDGYTELFPPPWRLMPIAEVIRVNNYLPDEWLGYGLRFFWADDQSNYGGVYLDGPLCGRVCLERHDDHDLSPRFRSVSSFLSSLLATLGEHQGDELTFDYTLLGPRGTEAQIEADWLAANELLSRYTAATQETRCDYAMVIMALTPLVQTEFVLPFLDDPNMWIPERAAEVVGARKYAPAIPQLAAVARSGRANGAMASMRALEAINTADSLDQLRRIREAK